MPVNITNCRDETYSLLSERNITETQWDEVVLDLIGPWMIPVRNYICTFSTLTYIDPVIGLTEIT